jgi:hypothetical protein
MSAKVQLPKRVLSQSEVEQHHARVEALRAEGKPPPNGFYNPPNQMADQTRQAAIRRSEKILEADPHNIGLSAVEKNRLERRAAELKARLVSMMVPKSHIDQKASGDPAFRKAVNHVVKSEMSPQFSQMAQEWKKIQRLLHPDDPSESNLETIRPERA